jgi:hypothetical protein
MKVFFAIPAYRGIQCVQFTESMEATLKLCQERGHEFVMSIMEGCCYIQVARNELVKRFLQTDCDTLFFLDDDISWPAQAAIDLIEMDDEVVAGVYPFKTEEDNYPVVVHTDGNHYPIVRGDGCIQAYSVPTGFLAIKRSTIEKMIAYYPEQKYSNFTPEGELQEEIYDLFPQGVHNGRWVGEDYAFCRLWADIGGEIWVKPDIDFIHHGKRAFKGNYHQFLMRQPK